MQDATWRRDEPPRQGRYDWPGIMRILRERPGEWLLVAEDAPRSIQHVVKTGRVKVLSNDRDWNYHCRVRNTNGSRADIWMSATEKEREETGGATAESDDRWTGSDGPGTEVPPIGSSRDEVPGRYEQQAAQP